MGWAAGQYSQQDLGVGPQEACVSSFESVGINQIF